MALTTFVPSTDFNTLTLTQVQQLRPETPDADTNRFYIEGDHLQAGKAWVGPGPTEGDDDYSEFLKRLARVFVSKNVILEVTGRLVSAVLGREPRWPWVPRRAVTKDKPVTDAESAAITELEQALTVWWDEREIHKLLKRLLFRMLWGRQCVFRLYVPTGLLPASGNIRKSTLTDALGLIYLEIPEPEEGFVYVHPENNAKLGVVLYQDVTGRDAAELTFLDETGRTVVKTLPEADVGGGDFRKHLTIVQVSVDTALITEQVRQLQDALNVTLTLLLKGLNDNHFLERLFFDTLAPGHWEYEDDGQGGKRRGRYVPDPEGRATGGRVDSYLQSLDYVDEEGKTVLAPGRVTIRDPLDPSGTIKGVDYWYQALLEEVRQTHILINQSATPSGKSRDESRVDFSDSGKDPELQAELAGRELLTTVMAMAEAFMGTPGKWTDRFKPAFKCNARYGKLSVEERTQNMNEVEVNLMSEETAMSLNGIDDVDAEKSIISRQPNSMLKLSRSRAETVTLWAAEFPREVALQLAGVPEDEVNDIMTQTAKAGVAEDPKQQPPEPAPNAP